eukprot:TRINITY_DN4908_c0_g1_i2.p1 TRINITY_DN4908_c0_g1~~TRINITY_DN4908_c0_g1_i2.p1  ORF type:complete len:129 (-),score=39.46 TRINITY_DN4908_c0_g1_i2:38-424(-)
MVEVYDARFVSLHVRRSNRAALNLYHGVLKFRMSEIEAGYYADGEDAFAMKKPLDSIREELRGFKGKHLEIPSEPIPEGMQLIKDATAVPEEKMSSDDDKKEQPAASNKNKQKQNTKRGGGRKKKRRR